MTEASAAITPDTASPARDDVSDDSAYYDDLNDLTTSLSSSILAYQFEHGRRYHAYHAGKYVLPNDEAEQERLDLTYHAWRLMFDDKPFFAPVKNPQAILDIGTGTGIWAMDVGDAYPSAEVIGTDLSPIQPKWVPPNVKFEIDDAEQEWTYPPDRFDLIHTRICNGLCIKDWPKYYASAFKHLKPNGFVESQEFDAQFLSDDDTLPSTSVSLDWVTQLVKGAAIGGINLRVTGAELGKAMKEAGFVDVVVREYKLPMGPWCRDEGLRQAGLASLVATMDGVQGISLKIFTGLLGWKVEELEVYLATLRKEWRMRKLHCYNPCFVITGRKPAEGEKVDPNQPVETIPAPKLVAASVADGPPPKRIQRDTVAGKDSKEEVAGKGEASKSPGKSGEASKSPTKSEDASKSPTKSGEASK